MDHAYQPSWGQERVQGQREDRFSCGHPKADGNGMGAGKQALVKPNDSLVRTLKKEQGQIFEVTFIWQKLLISVQLLLTQFFYFVNYYDGIFQVQALCQYFLFLDIYQANNILPLIITLTDKYFLIGFIFCSSHFGFA